MCVHGLITTLSAQGGSWALSAQPQGGNWALSAQPGQDGLSEQGSSQVQEGCRNTPITIRLAEAIHPEPVKMD